MQGEINAEFWGEIMYMCVIKHLINVRWQKNEGDNFKTTEFTVLM